jgi:pimeloyl-ACP methyl ester carboxylesterase
MLYSKIEGEGKPFLIIHGFLGMSDNWKTLGLQFAQLGFQIHLLDMRNHGKSFHSEEFNYEIMVEDVKTYIDFHNLQDITLLGHSMGGKVAMHFSQKFPEKIEKLVVVDMGVKQYTQHHQEVLEAFNKVDLEGITARSQVELILSDFIESKGVRQFLLKNLYWKEKGELAWRVNFVVLETFLKNKNP